MILGLTFTLCALAIIYSGSKLSKYGDILAEKTGLGRSFVGVVLLASVTSLPELVTGISAVAFVKAPDIAVGDVLGSCVFNLLILAMLDALHKPMPISTSAHQGHVLSAALGIVLLSIVSFNILLPQYNAPLGWIGSGSLIVAAIYFLSLKLISVYEKKQLAKMLKGLPVELQYVDIPTRRIVIFFILHSVVIVLAAAYLPAIGANIAVATGLGETFVGSIFMAMTSSLPEFVVCIAAIRMKAVDLAIGNLFGSNLFNVFILGIDDVFFIAGPLLSFASPNHIFSALSAIVMTAISIVGLTYKAGKKNLPLAWDSIAMTLVFVANLILLVLLAR